MNRFFLLLCFLVSQVSVLMAGEVEKTELSYVVKMGILRIGRAKWHILGKTRIDNKECVHLRIEINTPQLKDKEDIYLETEHFFPYKIFRELSYLGMKENIIEKYDYGNKLLSVEKNGRHIVVFAQQRSIDNVFALVFRLWKNGQRPESGMELQLPKQLFKIIVGPAKSINTRIGKLRAIRVESQPTKVIVFFRESDMLPVLIKGAIPILPYNLTIE